MRRPHRLEAGVGKEQTPGDELSGGFGPRGCKCSLELHHRGPLEAHVRLSPLFVVVAVAQPVVCQAESAGIRHTAVDHHDAHVRSVGCVMNRVPAERAKLGNLDTGVAQRLEPIVGEMLRPERVDEKQYPYLGARPFLENCGHGVRDFSGQRVVHLHGNGVLRRAKIGPKPRVRAVAVQFLLHAVSRKHMSSCEELECSFEQGIG